MASVYKLKRKSSKIQEKQDLTPKENLTPDLFAEQAETPVTENPKDKIIEEIFDPKSAPSPQKANSEDLFKTLSVPKADSDKLEAIFGAAGGFAGFEKSKEDDKTADLLKDVYADSRSSVGKADLSDLELDEKEDKIPAMNPDLKETSYDAAFIESLERISVKAENLSAENTQEDDIADPEKDVLERTSEESNSQERKELETVSDTETPPISDESFLEALSVPKVDSDKLEEVFSVTRGTVGVDSSKEEYNETADLLREIFGNERSPARSKQSADPEAEVLEETDSGSEVLESAENAESAVTTESADKAEDSEAETGEEKQAEPEYVADHGGETEKTIDYIAIHDGESEKTIEYGSMPPLADGAVDPAAIAQAAPPPLADELQVSKGPISDDPYNTTYEDAEAKYERKPVLPEEFNSPEEFDEFSEHLRNKSYRALSSLLWTFLAFLAGLYIESATFSDIYHPEFLKPGGVYNAIYLLVDLQFIFVSALLTLPSLISGIKALFKGKPDRSTVMFLLYLFTALHTIILISCGAKEYPLFGCIASFFAFLNSFANFLDAKRVYRTFRICGNKGDKIVAKPLSSDSPEAEAFREELEGEPHFFSIQKAKFIDKFFARANEQGKAERSFAWLSTISLFVSVAFAVISFFKNPDIASTASNFMTMMVMTLPLSCVFSISLPFAHMAAKSEKLGSAIISLSAAEEYASADVVSFTDREIFPPKSVKITTIRTYGQTRIDKAILYSAMIFQKLGGPLSEVFKKTISGVVQEISEDFEFKEITADGMCAFIDGQDIFVGNKNYLLSYDFGYTRDEQDKAFEAKQGKIMYMVIGNELAAKFYLRYSISKQFKKTVLSLFRSGICPAVKTCDPNFDSGLFRALLQNKRIPAAIIKSCEAMKDAPAVESSDSGIVCVSSIAKLLRTFSFCEGLHKVTRTNVVTKILSALVGIGVVLFLFFFGSLTKITTLFVLIYQLLWLIPIIIPSLTE